MDKAQKQNHRPAKFKAIQELFFFVKPYRSIFYTLVLLTCVLGVLGPVQPYIVQYTIDQLIAQGNYSGLVRVTILLIGLLGAQVIIQYSQTYLADWLGQQVIKDIRIRIYEHILQLKTSFFNRTPVGRLVTRNISDTEALADVFSQGLAALLSDSLQIILMITLMVLMNWWLALMSLITLPLLALLIYVFKEKIKAVFQTVRDAVSQLNVFVQERLVGMNVVQAFGREAKESEQFKALNKVHQAASIRSVLYYNVYFPLFSLINSISISILIWYGAQEVLQERVTLGQLTAFLMYIQLFFRPLHLLADRFNTLQMGVISIERIVQLLKNGEQAPDHGTYSPPTIQGEIAFQHVWFAYEKEHYVLQDVSLHLPARTSLAIVGATGAGKSTIINLIERFYEPQKGQITLDGICLNQYPLQFLRKHIGLVLQDVFLFSGSIYENLTLGNTSLSREKVAEAAHLIGIHDFITQLPGGYDYNVMERGMTLSMGQRQLLAFARVLIHNPCILILDEATASLDAETEQLIQQATATLMQNRTCIIIAHRLSTIQHADKILVMDQGKIQEEGTHETLLARDSHYAALHRAV